MKWHDIQPTLVSYPEHIRDVINGVERLTDQYWTIKELDKEMELQVFEYIERWYNKVRRHSAIVNLNIDEFWAQIND